MGRVVWRDVAVDVPERVGVATWTVQLKVRCLAPVRSVSTRWFVRGGTSPVRFELRIRDRARSGVDLDRRCAKRLRVRKFGGGAQLARIEPKELKARNQRPIRTYRKLCAPRACSPGPAARSAKLSQHVVEAAVLAGDPCYMVIRRASSYNQGITIPGIAGCTPIHGKR